MKDVQQTKKTLANRVETLPAATGTISDYLTSEMTKTKLRFPATTTKPFMLTRALAQLAPAQALALAPAADASETLDAEDPAAEDPIVEPPRVPQHRQKQRQQGLQTPRAPASPEDAQSIQILAAPAPEPRNAVKGSPPGTRMAKPRFKAVRATIEADPAPGATATDAPTIIRHEKQPNPKLARRQRLLIRCFAIS